MSHRRYTKRGADGKRRECVLSRVYRNMKGRSRGNSTKSPWCYMAGFPWKSYAAFRDWALASGFCKVNCSPDRDDTTKPYGPANVTWVPKHVNCSTSSGRAWFMRNHDDVRGREPPLPPLYTPGWSSAAEALVPPPYADVPF